ncbi:TRAP transporter small permease [Thermodesulfobacteriota bacterium]
MQKALKIWNTLEKYFVGIVALTATLFAFWGVVTRYGFSYSLDWLEEIVVYLIIWSVFVVASTVAEERGHVGATFFVEMLPPTLRRLVETLTASLALTFCVLICYWGYQIVHIAYITDERSSTIMRYPQWCFYLALPVGMTLVSARYLKRLYRLIFCFSRSELLEHHEMSREVHQQSDSTDGLADGKEKFS